MKRRKFITTSVLTGAATATLANPLSTPQQSDNEIYEFRTYELKFGGNRGLLVRYIKETLQPALLAVGAKKLMLFSELGNSDPGILRLLIAYPNFDVYLRCIQLMNSPGFIKKAADYAAEGQTYNRISSSLLYAFDGLKQMLDPIENAGLYELRIYEGVNEDATRRKIKMFNVEEIDLFYRTELMPIFFANMITGPYVPCLVYMINFRDMAHHDAAWKSFIDHPEWNAMRVKEEYKDTVSNIRKTFLELV